jgi:hypothetical protein
MKLRSAGAVNRAMPFDPATLQNLSIFEPPPPLAEQYSERLQPMRGWATPRRRPRRVWKKLRARGWTAHYGGAFLPKTQLRMRTDSAPALAVELLKRGATPLLVRYKALRWDGDKATLAPELPGDQMDYREAIPGRILTTEELAIPRPAGTRTLIGRDYFYDRQVGCRTLEAIIRIFTLDGIDPMRGDARRLFQRAAIDLGERMLIVSRGLARTSKVIARQSSYRPVR